MCVSEIPITNLLSDFTLSLTLSWKLKCLSKLHTEFLKDVINVLLETPLKFALKALSLVSLFLTFG